MRAKEQLNTLENLIFTDLSGFDVTPCASDEAGMWSKVKHWNQKRQQNTALQAGFKLIFKLHRQNYEINRTNDLKLTKKVQVRVCYDVCTDYLHVEIYLRKEIYSTHTAIL